MRVLFGLLLAVLFIGLPYAAIAAYGAHRQRMAELDAELVETYAALAENDRLRARLQEVEALNKHHTQVRMTLLQQAWKEGRGE